ncbi:hypothetical protein C8034_v003316 [Colletotrichum sidae]|uniref:Uncharacterized protein n=1 Tax=Colletotrichum sidae TaxID=1347389 RepID=A0A4V6QFA1_9PEZI|nr:hypothetical protein C8034_v003316 [Colletotrichum sidae]
MYMHSELGREIPATRGEPVLQGEDVGFVVNGVDVERVGATSYGEAVVTSAVSFMDEGTESRFVVNGCPPSSSSPRPEVSNATRLGFWNKERARQQRPDATTASMTKEHGGNTRCPLSNGPIEHVGQLRIVNVNTTTPIAIVALLVIVTSVTSSFKFIVQSDWVYVLPRKKAQAMSKVVVPKVDVKAANVALEKRSGSVVRHKGRQMTRKSDWTPRHEHHITFDSS